MPYLIDGNNLLGHSKEINLKSPHSREILIREILAFQREKSFKITVIFDGSPDEYLSREYLSLGDLEVRFAGQKSDADSLILKIIERSQDPASFTLVSSDKSLTDKARFLRAKVMKCHQFKRKMERIKTSYQAKIEPKLAKEEIEEWMEYFNTPKKDNA